MPYYKCTRAAVITNSSFTKAAIELAAESGVILWGGNDVSAFEESARGKVRGVAPKTKSTLRFHRLEQGENCDEPLTIRIDKEEYILVPHKMTIVTAEEGNCSIVIGQGFRKRTVSLSLNGDTRDFAVGYYKKSIFLEEIR